MPALLTILADTMHLKLVLAAKSPNQFIAFKMLAYVHMRRAGDATRRATTHSCHTG